MVQPKNEPNSASLFYKGKHSRLIKNREFKRISDQLTPANQIKKYGKKFLINKIGGNRTLTSN